MRTVSAPVKALVGAAGKHFVLYRLYQQGLTASLASPESRDVDLVVMPTDGGSMATVRVRARDHGSGRGWAIDATNVSLHGPRSFFAFVDMDVAQGALPVTYIIPSSVVADMVAAARRSLRALPGRRDNRLQRIAPTHRFEVPGYPDGWMEAYREAWGSLRSAIAPRQEPLANGEIGGTPYAPALLPTSPPT